ncbi:hypothetical protein AArcSl_1781 [Halalkaliarchaeum desulfuricum]|uniref:Putative sensor domain-containing protein n=2 Tax=Halalkaliarchaeum desulfuricum TaxID=2055893 RepID=A0A343TJY7_9EURY|nr:hypothetical protein AArcSl_1781 [Halalkaliarchaeum desulfuricum]
METSAHRKSSRIRDAVSVIFEAQTYRNILYLALSFPLGLVYFVALTVGLSLGLGLAVLLIGIGLLVVVLLGSRVVAAFERELANVLLDVTIDSPDDISASGAGLPASLDARMRAASTWKGLGFLYLKFWVGIAALVALSVGVGLTLALVTAPLHYNDPNVAVTGIWTIDTLPEAIVAVPIGIIVGVLSLFVLNALAQVSAWMAKALLD